MAIIPKAQAQARPEAGRLPYQSGRGANASAFGALTGQALAQVGNEVSQLGEQAAKIVIQTNEENIRRYSRDLDNEYAAFHEQVLLGDGTAENQGYLSLNGENAVQGLPNVTKLLAEKRAELAARAGNQKVSDYFNQAADVRDEQTGSAMFRHVNTQREVANDASADARVSRAKSDAALYFNDQSIIDRSSMILSEEIFSKAKRKGWSDEAAQEAFRLENADMVDKMVTSALQTDIKQAEKLFQAYGQDVDGVTKAAMFQKLDAKRRQIIADMESQERDSDTDRKKFQEGNASRLTAMFAMKTLTANDLTNAIIKREITDDDYRILNNLLNEPPGGEVPNQEAYLNMKIGIHQGTVKLNDISADARINGKQKSELITLYQTELDKGGVLARADVKSAREYIDVQITGMRGYMAAVTGDAALKAADALEYFNKKVMNALPADLDKAENIQKWRDETLSMFKTGGLGSPERNLKAFPRPSVWPTSTVYGPRKQMDMLYGLADTEIRARIEEGTISQEDAIEELKLLARYRQEIEQITD